MKNVHRAVATTTVPLRNTQVAPLEWSQTNIPDLILFHTQLNLESTEIFRLILDNSDSFFIDDKLFREDHVW